MSRYRGPIVRKSRRYGVVLFQNGASKQNAFNKRKYPPGQHGRSSFKKPSEFGRQLIEKQKARFLFGITEKQFRIYYAKAEKMEGITGDNLLRLLEQRLDNVVFRSGIAATRRQARQMVSHGLIKLNGTRVSIPSIIVKPGDEFIIREKLQGSPLFAEIKKTKKPVNPKWMEINYAKLSGKIIATPEKDDLEQIIDSQMIVEFYSK